MSELDGVPPTTPIYKAQHAQRFQRQALIRRYQEATGARLVVMIDAIFYHSVTLIEELLIGADRSQPIHLMLASPGGDGEVAVRLLRALQDRCSELTIIVPDMAKSAATIMCLGADRILMPPSGDLGPVDAQFQINGNLVGAKDIIEAVREAEERVSELPGTYPLYSGLLADVNMLMVEQARSATARSYDLIREALECSGRFASAADLEEQAGKLKGPLVDEALNHGATLGPVTAAQLGLPVDTADFESETWQTLWELWTLYFIRGAFPGPVSVYEGERASQIMDHR